MTFEYEIKVYDKNSCVTFYSLFRLKNTDQMCYMCIIIPLENMFVFHLEQFLITYVSLKKISNCKPTLV